VAASIGLHLDVRRLFSSGLKAILVGGAASAWMAALTLALIATAAGGSPGTAALLGLGGLALSFSAWRVTARGKAGTRVLEARFARGLPLSLAEATELLDAREAREAIDEELARRVLRQLHPAIGELIPARDSPLRHGDGSRWTTYWQGTSGWSLVAVCRDPRAATPIHAHPHRLLAKTIEGSVEELRFQAEGDDLHLVERRRPAHDELVETAGLATIHLIRNVGPRPAIDLQLRGPEEGSPGRRFIPAAPVDLDRLTPGTTVLVRAEADDRPGHGGEGAAGGRWHID
jgi:hypothetical protein